ncbi:MAG: hypothetical protein KBA33_03350 [Cloacibacterium sp.]|jgi:small-conductance mechanosensitive channel|nr:hypothetical protein [Cloacibacterium sp.]
MYSQNSKKPHFQTIIKESFGYWSRTLPYQFLFSILYFLVLYIFANYFSGYLGVKDKIIALYPLILENPDVFTLKFQEYMLTDDFRLYVLSMIFSTSLVYPLNIGLLSIYRKLDNKEEFSAQDLFEGYSGAHFFRYMSYYFSWGMIYNYAKSLLIPALIWVMVTLLVAPIMHFRKERLGSAIVMSFQMFIKHFSLFFSVTVVTFLLVYSGLTLFFAGVLLTFPFWNAVVYVLYQHLLSGDEDKTR